jgi:DNA-binding winged helix-turn-helix (wHTH) protein/TolB-like protein/tetratricopeptide (TPR) repeat protein
MESSQPTYEFGDFVLHVGQQRLTRRNGDSIAVTGKAFDTLVYLVEHAGEPVEKEALLKAIWPGVIVEENSLTQVISSLRQHLRESPSENRYIATLPRKGYKFVAVVKRREAGVVSKEPSRKSQRARWFALLAFIVATAIAVAAILSRQGIPIAAEPVRTLAILPFKPVVPEQRNLPLELGMADSLIAQLAQRSDQLVVPLSSVRRYAAIDQDPIAAGRALGVDSVLDGSIQRQDDRLRVSARLLRVADARQLWAQTFDQPFTGIFDVQDAIATRIAAALSLQTASTEAIAQRRGTRDPEAYALYASGRFAFARLTERTLLQSIDLYRQALALDPDYALAYSGIADCYALLSVIGSRPPREVFPLARVAADKALDLDSRLAAAYTARGQIRAVYDRDLRGALEDLNRAAELDPQYAPTYFYRGVVYGARGDIERSRSEFQRAQQLEPLALARPAAAALSLMYLRRYDEAIAELRRVLALDEGFDLARGFLIRTLLAKGAYDQALEEVQGRSIQTLGSYGFLAQALALSGHQDEARAERDRVLALQKQQYISAYDIAMIYAAFHDADNTFLWMDRAVEERATALAAVGVDPLLDFLRSDPRFAVLVKRIGLYETPLPES